MVPRAAFSVVRAWERWLSAKCVAHWPGVLLAWADRDSGFMEVFPALTARLLGAVQLNRSCVCQLTL